MNNTNPRRCIPEALGIFELDPWPSPLRWPQPEQLLQKPSDDPSSVTGRAVSATGIANTVIIGVAVPAASGGLDRYLTGGSLERLLKSPEVSGSGVEQLPPLGERQAVDVAEPEDSGAVEADSVEGGGCGVHDVLLVCVPLAYTYILIHAHMKSKGVGVPFERHT